MDLLFKKYASPFLFINGMIRTKRFCEFVEKFVKKENESEEERLDWDVYLHKVYDMTFAEFKESINQSKENQKMPKETLETTVKESLDILNGFCPDERGEE